MWAARPSRLQSGAGGHDRPGGGGRRVSPKLRVAFEVADARDVTDHLTQAGAALLAPPVRTPWGSINSRLEAPGDLQITVFEESAGRRATVD